MSLPRRFLHLLSILLAGVAVLGPACPLRAQIPVNLGNFVWDDRDGDGAQDDGEPGLKGITVQLWNTAKSQLLDSAVTNTNGNYIVVAPRAGDYRLRVVVPGLLDQFSPKDLAGGNNSADSDFNPSGAHRGFTDIFNIASNVVSAVHLDCGLLLHMLPGHTIGNRVFRAASDGLQPSENAAVGFTGTVELLNSSGAVLQTTTTTQLGLNRGYYGFIAPPGIYRLRFTNGASYIPTPHANVGSDDSLDSDIAPDGLTPLFTLMAGQVRSDLDAGFVLPVNLGNFVWDDRDGDGTQDAGEPGLEGITIQLWNAAKSQLLNSAVTNANGNYTVVAPGPGDYRLRVLLPGSLDEISPIDLAGDDNLTDSDFNPSGLHRGFTDIFNIASNVISAVHLDCGLLLHMLPGHTIGNRVFRAPPGGLQPSENASLGFVGTVELLSSSGAVLQTTTTRQLGLNRGYYGFNAPPGLYRLRFTATAGYRASPYANSGSDDTVDSDVGLDGLTPFFILAAGQIRADLDAGFVLPVNMGNRVWHDQNGNGLQDTDEPGIPNVVVELWSADRTRRWDATITNATGTYSLQAPSYGEYRLLVLRPLPTDTFSPMNQGPNVIDDSNIIPIGSDLGFTDVISIASNVISTVSIDAGIQFPPGPRSIPPLEITALNRALGILSFTGPISGTYQLERSTQFESWSAVGSPFVTSNSPTAASLGAPPLLGPQWFWRVRRTR